MACNRRAHLGKRGQPPTEARHLRHAYCEVRSTASVASGSALRVLALAFWRGQGRMCATGKQSATNGWPSTGAASGWDRSPSGAAGRDEGIGQKYRAVQPVRCSACLKLELTALLKRRRHPCTWSEQTARVPALHGARCRRQAWRRARRAACSARAGQKQADAPPASPLRRLGRALLQRKPAKPPPPPEKPRWRFLSPEAYLNAPAWDIPWGWPVIVSGMLLWAGSFIVTGVLALPLGAVALGVDDIDKLSTLQSSQLMLFGQVRLTAHAHPVLRSRRPPRTPPRAAQVVSTVVGVALIYSIGRRQEGTPDDFLAVSTRAPFAAPTGWLAWSLIGFAAAPFAITLSALLVSLLPVETTAGKGTVDAVAGLVETVDKGVFLNLLLLTGVCAPVLEETVFRGFLLASLTKHMPVAAAVVASSLTFAACHASVRDFPQLFALGCVMGFAYCRSRNLLTSMVIHGAWNSGVIAVLYTLVSSGMSMEQILGG